MAPGMVTPLFHWPDIGDGQTWDSGQQRNVYPTSKARVERRIRTKQQLHQLEDCVATVLNLIDCNAGNIASLIAKDLASPAAEQDLNLLPRVDSYIVTYGHVISKECASMLQEKAMRYRRQHAHDMALKNEIDIVLTWDCPEIMTEAAIRWVSPEEASLVQEAHECYYKYLNWDLMHADEKEEDDPSKPVPGECRRPKRKDKDAPFEPPGRKGGFYACVSLPLLPQLMHLSSNWGIACKIVLAPNFMTPEEQQEMASYHATRRVIENEMKLQEAKKEVEAELERQRVASEEYEKRKVATYSTVYEAGRDRFKRVDVHVDQGGLH